MDLLTIEYVIEEVRPTIKDWVMKPHKPSLIQPHI